MMAVVVVTLADDLEMLVQEINRANWDSANDIPEYDAASLSTYIARQDTLFVACRDAGESASTLLGIASARFEVKPYSQKSWLYVDEVDVCVDQRRRGAGKAMMRKLIEIAKESGCEEVWLGTEVDNGPANALYRALDPDDVTQVLGYTYELQG